MSWPSESTDTVIYGEREFIADRGIALRMLDNNRLDVWGKVYLNGELLSQSTEPGFTNDTVTNAMLVNMAQNTLKGRVTAGTGDPEDLTATQVTALLNLFSATLKGLVPPPGTATGKYLKDDGTWELVNIFTTTTKGLVPAPVTSTGKHLKDDGTWVLPTPTTYFGSITWNPGLVANNAIKNTNVTVTNAAVGDVVAVGFSIATVSGVLFFGNVISANTVRVTVFNYSGSDQTIASGTLKVRAWKND